MYRTVHGGGGGIRTHESFCPIGFQDQCTRPLCDPSQWWCYSSISVQNRSAYLIPNKFRMVDLSGFEPLVFAMRMQRFTN